MRNIHDTRTMTTYELLKYAKRGIFEKSMRVEYKVDKLKKEGNEEYKKYESEINKLDEQYNEIADIMREMYVNDIPTIEIVMCKDCKHFNNGDCTELPKLVSETDYCSYGERIESMEVE